MTELLVGGGVAAALALLEWRSVKRARREIRIRRMPVIGENVLLLPNRLRAPQTVVSLEH